MLNSQINSSCSLLSQAFFRKGERILSLRDHTGRGGILESGEAHLALTNENGEETYLEIFSTGDCFSDFYVLPIEYDDLSIIADSDCQVTFINIQKAMMGCQKECVSHPELLKMLILMSSRHSKMQYLHLSILSKRSIREKLLLYLRYCALTSSETDEFQIPMILNHLASYLCVDRSAMMREIRKMNEEGLIRSKGRRFQLLIPPDDDVIHSFQL